MENIILFILTVVLYFSVWGLFRRSKKFSGYVKRVALLALLCLPLNINGHVFTIAGNAVGEKDVYSLFSIYQKAEKGSALAITGLVLYQQAGEGAATVVGLAGYQKAGGNARVGMGLAGYQKAGSNAMTAVGLAGYQQAGENAIVVLVGLTGYQQAGRDAVTVVGLAGYQQAGNSAQVYAGLSLYQRVGPKTRSFGAFTKLE